MTRDEEIEERAIELAMKGWVKPMMDNLGEMLDVLSEMTGVVRSAYGPGQNSTIIFDAPNIELAVSEAARKTWKTTKQ